MRNLSIVIVNYRSWTPLENCLNSLFDQKNIDLEIVVVDNNSNDNKISEFKDKFQSVKWIENKINYGFAKACNIGEEASSNEQILFLNPDTILPENVLSELLNKEMDFSSKIVSIKQLNKKEKNTNAYGYFLSLLTFNGIMRSMYRFSKSFDRSKIDKLEYFNPDWISGSFVLISKSDFKKIGGWDERFWMYYEDMDLCKTARNNGMEIVMFNDLSCYHFHGLSSRVDLETKIITKTEVILSSIKFARKHYSGIHKNLLVCLIVVSKLLELMLSALVLKSRRGVLFRFLKRFECF